MSNEVPSRPPFRVTVEELSDDDALRAIEDAHRKMCEFALAQRRLLLEMGFADNHGTCEFLDSEAGLYTIYADAARTQRVARKQPTRKEPPPFDPPTTDPYPNKDRPA